MRVRYHHRLNIERAAAVAIVVDSLSLLMSSSTFLVGFQYLVSAVGSESAAGSMTKVVVDSK